HDVQSPTKHIFKRRRYKSSYININKERVFIELYDQIIFMTNYCFKYLTPTGREFPGGKFNQKFNICVTYRFFQENLDHLKKIKEL
ncbi:hypothetical protein HID58_075076, partial [Brassica napus]